MLSIVIGVGGCLGAWIRFFLFKWLNKESFPWGTLLVNGLGAFFLGGLTAYLKEEILLNFWGIGFLGAFTTFSTIQLESIQMIRKREWKKVCIYLGATYILGMIIAYCGYQLGEWSSD